MRGLLDHLFDARRVDAAVLDQTRQGQARNLAPHAVERRQHDGVRRVVDDQVDAGGVLEGADVAALAADDAALHVLARDLDDRDGRLRDGLGGDALDRRGDDFTRARPGVLLDLFLDLAHEAVGVFTHLRLDLRHEDGLGLGLREVRDALQSRRGAGPGSLRRACRASSIFFSRSRQRAVAAVQRFLLAVEVFVALGDALF